MSDDIRQQKWQRAFPFIAIGVVVLMLLALGGVYAVRVALPEALRDADRAASASRLHALSMGIVQYAMDHSRQYPDHVGRMLGSYAPPQMFLDPRNRGATPPAYAGEPRPGPVYRFGDVIFLYDGSTEFGKLRDHIVAVTVTDWDPDSRNIVKADGSVMRVETANFPSVLAADNAARKAAGVLEIDIKEIEALDRSATP